MKLSFSQVLVVAVVSVFGAVGCGSEEPADDDSGATEDHIEGSPTEQKAKAEAVIFGRYQGELIVAYEQAPLSAFTEVAGKDLAGDLATDFTTMTRNCTAAKGFSKISAQRWTVNARSGPTSTAPPASRKLFTVDAYNSKIKKTMNIGIYDEKGTFIVGRKWFEYGNSYEREKTSADFRATIAACAPPKYPD